MESSYTNHEHIKSVGYNILDDWLFTYPLLSWSSTEVGLTALIKETALAEPYIEQVTCLIVSIVSVVGDYLLSCLVHQCLSFIVLVLDAP